MAFGIAGDRFLGTGHANSTGRQEPRASQLPRGASKPDPPLYAAVGGGSISGGSDPGTTCVALACSPFSDPAARKGQFDRRQYPVVCKAEWSLSSLCCMSAIQNCPSGEAGRNASSSEEWHRHSCLCELKSNSGNCSNYGTGRPSTGLLRGAFSSREIVSTIGAWMGFLSKKNGSCRRWACSCRCTDRHSGACR